MANIITLIRTWRDDVEGPQQLKPPNRLTSQRRIVSIKEALAAANRAISNTVTRLMQTELNKFVNRAAAFLK